MTRKILFICGSFGLGHVFRDLEIAKEFRRQIPDSGITWLASEPARSVLISSGETLHPLADKWAAETDILESINKSSTEKGKVFHANPIRYLLKFRTAWNENVKLFNGIMKEESYDLVIGDETFEINLALRNRKVIYKPAFIMILDFIGADVMSKSAIETLIAYRMNYQWSKYKERSQPVTPIFIGEERDVPDKKFGFMLPDRKQITKNRYNFVGYILSFNPEDYQFNNELRKRLGFGSESYIVCSVGGTSIGLPLLELCCRTFPLVKKQIPDIKLVLVAGPRICSKNLNIPEEIILKEYVSKLYEYFAACDLAIVQGGSTTTLELTALKKPFIYFPVEGHFEQQLHVAPRLQRLNAGVKMQFSQTTPEILAEKIISNIGKKVNYPSIPLEGAKNAVKIIREITGN
jgi:UDP-N-acetylglucosamine:LPS N-acetylglucosamine transferase